MTGLLHRLRRDEGAIAVLASGVMLLCLAASALAIDVGALVFQEREMRKVADLAALDAVLVLSERSAEFPDPQAGAEQIATATATDNGFVPGSDGSLVVHVGRWEAATGSFTPGIADANAVRVTASNDVGFQFAPGSRTARQTAVATAEDLAGIAIGTGLAELDTSESALLNPLLEGLLGTSVGLTAVHYEGLADLDVPIGALATALEIGAGGIDEFLATDVSVAELAQAMIDANPDMTTAQAEALGVLAGLSAGRSRVAFPLGDILDVAADLMDGGAFADAGVNALTLLTAAAQAANRNNAVDLSVGALLPTLSGGTLASSTLRVGIIEPPQIAIGPARRGGDGEWVTVARSAQVRLSVVTQVDLDESLLGGLLPARLRLPLYVGAAEGTAALTENSCAADPAAARMGVDASTGGATLRIAEADNAQLTGAAEPTGPAHLVRLQASVLGITTDVADVYGEANATVAAGGTALEFAGPFDWDNVQQTSAVADPKGLLLSDLEVWAELLGSSLLSWILSAVTSTVTNVITPLVEQLLDALYDTVVQPTLSLLGADLAVADVTAWHQACGPRVLVQ